MNKLRLHLAAVLIWGLSAPTLFARGGGGCLEEGTPILTPTGPVPIERLRPGDAVLTGAAGMARPATVQQAARTALV